MRFEILPYRPEFRPGVIALQRHLVSPIPELNDAYFRWKHEANPYTREPQVYVALADGKVAGMRAFLGTRWQIADSGATASWPCACDFVVDPVHRGQKLFRQIMNFAIADLARQGIGPFLNWSASPVTYGVSLRAGWRLVGSYAAWGRQTLWARHVRSWAKRARRVPLVWRVADRAAALALHAGFDAFDEAWSQSVEGAAFTITRQPWPEALAELARNAAPPRVRHARDATYYGWRFGNPLSDYRFVIYRESGLEGFLVLQVARRGDAADISFVDWAAATPDLLATMLAKVVEIGGYDSLSIWTATFDADFIARLREIGFAPVDQTRGNPEYRPGLLVLDQRGSDLVNASDVAAASLADLGRWDLRMVYSDFY